MQTITTIGLDIAKSVFQVHGFDAAGQVVVRRQLKRRYVLAFFEKLSPCLVGIEACASSHHWSREIKALGHTVRLMPPAYVRPYVKRQKNDMADAEAICEAVTRANMRFVETKTPEQQSGLMLHRTRHLFIRQQTAVINAQSPFFGKVHHLGQDAKGAVGLIRAVTQIVVKLCYVSTSAGSLVDAQFYPVAKRSGCSGEERARLASMSMMPSVMPFISTKGCIAGWRNRKR
jgi:transposase